MSQPGETEPLPGLFLDCLCRPSDCARLRIRPGVAPPDRASMTQKAAVKQPKWPRSAV